MGNYLGAYKIGGNLTMTSLGSMRIGSAGTAAFLVAQWLAGFGVAAPPETVGLRGLRRNWLRYRGKQNLGVYDLNRKGMLEKALADTTESSGWVFINDLSFVSPARVKDRMLQSLVILHFCCTTMYENNPYILVTKELAKAVEIGTAGLQKCGAAWTDIATEACGIIQAARMANGYICIG